MATGRAGRAARVRSTLVAFAVLAGAAGAAMATEPTAPCRVPGLRHGVQCGVVQRPLDPARADGPTIDVHYVVVPAMARRKLPDPVFLLAGGPGQSAIGVAPQAFGLFRRLNNRRDIVFVDQRGTGKSAPLDCEATRHEPLAEQADPDAQLRLLMRCKAALLKRPYLRAEADLGHFTTALAMQDLDAVRRQLGAPQINLVGISYGTRAALDYMRQFPQAVRRSVLDGVAPPDMALPTSASTDSQAALEAVFSACQSQPACAAAHPTLRADWAALLASLPKAVQAAHPLTGQTERFELTRAMALAAVRGALYAPASAAALPVAIGAAAAGRYEALLGMAALLGSNRGGALATGMHFSVVCAEDMARLDQATDTPGTDFGAEQAALYRQACAAWPRGAVPAAFFRVPPSRTPTLLLSGGADPATPPRHAERVAQALGAAARHVVVPNAGHGTLGIGCMADVLTRFIDAETDAAAAVVDASCAQAIPRPGAFRPIELPAKAATP